MEYNKVLTETQLQAMELLEQGELTQDVADSLGITRMTLYNWRKTKQWKDEEEFRAEMNKDQAHYRSINYMLECIDSIADIAINSKSDRMRLDASMFLINSVMKYSGENLSDDKGIRAVHKEKNPSAGLSDKLFKFPEDVKEIGDSVTVNYPKFNFKSDDDDNKVMPDVISLFNNDK